MIGRGTAELTPVAQTVLTHVARHRSRIARVEDIVQLPELAHLRELGHLRPQLELAIDELTEIGVIAHGRSGRVEIRPWKARA